MTFWDEVGAIIVGVCVANVIDWVFHVAILDKLTVKWTWWFEK